MKHRDKTNRSTRAVGRRRRSQSAVIPSTPCPLEYDLGTGELWVPSREELSSDEGFGPYRDTWIISRVGVKIARQVAQDEATIVELISELADSVDTFEALAKAIEWSDPDSLTEEGIIVPDESPLHQFLLADDASPTYGLDLGVAGLVYALAAIGCYPEVSCRGHRGGWAGHPLVRFAARRWRAEKLVPIATKAECSLVLDSGTLLVRSASILNTMAMAQGVLENRKQFERNPAAPMRRRRPVDGEQLTLEL